MQWSEGSFALYRLAPDFQLPQMPPLPMQGLLLEAVRRADEMSVFRERLPSTAARLRRTDKEVSPAFLADPELAAAQRALGVFAPEASVADVAKVLFIAEFDATRACYELVKRGLVEIVRAQPNQQAKLRPDDEAKMEVFNVAFREVHDEVVRAGQLTSFTVGVQKYLTEPAHAFRTFFQEVELDHTGALPAAILARNLSVLSAEGHDAGTVITEALTELTFFMLFQCSAFLEPDVDEQLGRRVRLIHASLR